MATVSDIEDAEASRKPFADRDPALRIALAEIAEGAVSDGILAVDRRGHVVFVNPRFLALFHLKAEAVDGVSSRVLVDAIRGKVENPRKALAWMRKACKGGDATTEITLRDGRALTVVSLAAQRANANGAVLGRVWIVREAPRASNREDDQSSDKNVRRALNETREALAASEGLYRTLVSALVEGVLMIDGSGRVITCNEAAARTVGYTQDEVLSRSSYASSWNMVHEDFTPLKPAEHPSAIVLRTSEPVYDMTMGIRRRDGELRWINVNARPLIDKGETKPRAAVVSFFDVTGHKQDQDRLTQANHALAVLSRANETVVRADSERDLLDEMCRVLTETGGYRLAWIGLQTTQPEGTVRPVSAAGGGITLSNEICEGCGGVRLDAGVDADAVLKSGNPQIVSDLARQVPAIDDNAVVPRSGARIVLPLRDRLEALGVLVLYTDRPDAFGAEEEKLLVQLSDDLAYGIGSLRERAKIEDSQKHLRRSMEAAVQAVASTLEMRDPYTAGHQRDVARLAVAIAHEVGVAEDEIEGIYLAAIVHDIGKIRVPIDILSKPGALTHLEYQLIQTHAQIGYDIMKHVDFPWPVAQMILQHHERLDGSGYPAGLKGPEILQGAKIIAVADVVQAMSMHRPYRGAFGEAAALEEIQRGRGRLYDPAAVDACLKLFREKGFRFA